MVGPETNTPFASANDRAAALDALWGTRLFVDLDLATLGDVASVCRPWALKAGETLVRQGDRGDELYVVSSGRMGVDQRLADGSDIRLGEVRTGEFLGEIAFLEGGARTATATAEVDTRGLGLSRAALERFLTGHPTIAQRLRDTLQSRQAWARTRRLRPPSGEVAARLHAVAGPLDATTIAALGHELRWTTLPRGSLLFSQGDAGDAVYFVVSGTLGVTATRDDGFDVRIGVVGAGEPVGEMALLSGEPRMASVRAETDCELLGLSKAGYDTLVARAPQALGLFARTMAERLARSARARTAVATIRANPLVTLSECEEAVRTTDAVMLNLKITQLYHRVALDLTVILGAQDVNWFGFACRASKTAGSSIRREDVPLARPLGRLFPAALVDRLRGSGVARRVEGALAGIANRLAEGNRLIFSEIGPVFVRLVQACVSDAAAGRARLETVLATLRPGPSDAGGQDLLREAVTAYYEAAFEAHPKRKAELILLGSLKIGLHEQVRVDPIIDEALDAPAADLVDALAPWLARFPASWRAPERARRRVTQHMRRLITSRMMRIRLPYGDLRLGDDLPDLPAQRRFPDMLGTLEHSGLAQLFDRFDRGLPTRAVDWSELDERMRYIANLFRSRQKSLEIFEPPFLLDQQSAIRAGRVPAGPL
jgi:CRP-like cAMP-binding protein